MAGFMPALSMRLSLDDLKMFRIINIICVLFFICLTGNIGVGQAAVIQNEQVIVLYDSPLEAAAHEVAEIYPSVNKDLQDIFGWELMGRPRVVLINSDERFRKMVRNDIFVAFAIPGENLVVIDYSKMNISPFTLYITLKHELCHLLLHQHIGSANLPKWLDEGVCQWASDGIAEILMNKGQSVFRTSLVAGNLFSFASLADRFPADKRSLVLAYEQSKNLVDYIVKKYGKGRLLDILYHLKNGEHADRAVLKSLNVTLTILEEDWRRHLKGKTYWLALLANNIYAIVFFLAAVMAVLGFIKLKLRKRAYLDEFEDEDE